MKRLTEIVAAHIVLPAWVFWLLMFFAGWGIGKAWLEIIAP